MGIDFSQTVPLVDGVINEFLVFILLLPFRLIEDSSVSFFNFIHFHEHIINIIQNGLILGDSLFPRLFFELVVDWLPSDVFVLTHEITNILVLILHDRTFPFPHFNLLTQLTVTFCEVKNFSFVRFLLLLLQFS